MTKLPLYEKIGYATGDVATNLVSRGVLAYLAIFYTDTFGLTASAAAILFLVVRLSDGVTDIIIGIELIEDSPWLRHTEPQQFEKFMNKRNFCVIESLSVIESLEKKGLSGQKQGVQFVKIFIRSFSVSSRNTGFFEFEIVHINRG